MPLHGPGWNAGKGVGMQLLTAQGPAPCPSRCACNRTSRFMVIELEQAIDKAVEAVGLQ